MQELIGQIAAAIIAGVLLLALAVTQWRGQHTSVDATQFAAAKEGMLDLAEVMEEDLSNLGAGIAPANMGTTVPIQVFDTTSATRELRFYTWADTSDAFGDPRVNDLAYLVRYQWAATSENALVYRPATNTFVSVPTYLLTRTVNGAAAGEGLGTLTRLRFDLFNAAGAATGTLANVRTVEVSLRAVSPLGGGGADVEAEDSRPHISETRWHKRFRPANLGRPTP